MLLPRRHYRPRRLIMQYHVQQHPVAATPETPVRQPVSVLELQVGSIAVHVETRAGLQMHARSNATKVCLHTLS
jgi:hypothetical protein